MSIAFDKLVGESEVEVTSATQTVTVVSGGVAAGNLVVVGILTNTGVEQTVTSVTDARGNTYSLSSQVLGSAQAPIRTCVAYSILTTALQAGDLITATHAGSMYAGLRMVAVAYSGIDTSSPLDDELDTLDDGFPQSQPSIGISTVIADELLISWFASQNVRTFTQTSGWTRRGTLAPGASEGYHYEDRIVSSIGTYTSAPALSSDDYWNAHILGFKSGSVLDVVLPDADVVTTGWTTAPLFSKVNDSSDATVIQATAV